MQSLTLSETIDRFFTARQAARYSPNTLRDYQNTYKKFGSFLGTDLPISKINSTHITQFMASEEVMAVSKKTALNYHTGLSSLWNWAIENSLVEKNVVRTVKPPSPEKREIIPYSRAEVLKLIQVSRSGRNSLRDEAIVLTLLDTGMRAS